MVKLNNAQNLIILIIALVVLYVTANSSLVSTRDAGLASVFKVWSNKKSKGMGNICKSLSDCFVVCKSSVGRCNDFCGKNPSHQYCKTFPAAKAQPWVTNSITQPLPEGASKVRLILPAPLDEMSLKEFGSYGMHPGGHPEGLDHEWIAVDRNKVVRSLADGEVVYARLNHENSPSKEYRIIIFYGDGLWGEHMHVETPLVKEGQMIRAGEPVAYGEVLKNPNYQSGEINVADQHRRDGVGYWYKFVKGATLVSPFDYLRDDLKQQLTEKWQKEIMELYIIPGIISNDLVAKPWEPYLTNPILLHRNHKGSLVGEWYLRSRPWVRDTAADILVFFPVADYYSKQRIIGAEIPGQIINGDWEADYVNNRFTFTSYDSVYYGIFVLDESSSPAKLTIEYQKDSYPKEFSNEAMVYTERANISTADERWYWENKGKYPNMDVLYSNIYDPP